MTISEIVCQFVSWSQSHWKISCFWATSHPFSLFVTNISNLTPTLVNDRKVTVYFQIKHFNRKSVFWVQHRVCLLDNIPYPPSTSEHKWKKHNWFVLHGINYALDVNFYVNLWSYNTKLLNYYNSMVNFKVQKFRFEKILHIWMEWRKWFLEKIFYKNTYRCSANILVGVWEMLCRNIDIWLWKRTGRCSVKPQRYIPQKHWKIFWKDAKSLSAEQQGKFYRKNWDMFCKKTERCSTKILRGFLQK